MIGWTEIYREKLKADDNPSLAPSFTNLLLGLPYKETGTRPAMQAMLSLRGDYHERKSPKVSSTSRLASMPSKDPPKTKTTPPA